MSDSSGKHLQLVSEQSEEQLNRFKRFQEIMSAEFSSGSFERALSDHSFLMTCLRVKGVPIAESSAYILRLIPEVLAENHRIVKASNLPIQELIAISQSIGVNVAVEKWLDSEGLEVVGTPDLPQQNIRKHVSNFRGIIWGLVGILSHREELEELLKGRGAEIHNEDTTRLLIYDLNKDRIIPQVLVLPNDHHSYNPYLVILEHDVPLPTEVMNLLRCFSR